MKKYKVEFTEKELYLVWSLVCWFNKPFTSSLKYKLAGLASSPRRKHYDKKFEKKIISMIARIGISIKEKHPEWLKEKS